MTSEQIQDSQSTQPRVSFDDILRSSSLPSPGPEYYEARRRIWLTPQVTPAPPPPSTSRQKLEELFSQPSAVHSQEAWNNGLEKVWKGLSSGGRLKYTLPMAIIIKIIHAAWLRDRTWPVGMEAPDSDEEQQAEGAPPFEAPIRTQNTVQAVQHAPATTFTRSDLMEPVPPWMLINRT